MSTVLIADDNRQNLYILETILKSRGHSIVSAENGREALELARQSPPDLVIADILMPVMDGFELCRRWKADERLGVIPFVFYTATYTDQKDEEFALSLGAERFVLKPQQPETLLCIVDEVLESARACPVTGDRLLDDEMALLRQYNEALFRRLEKKMAQLEAEVAERKQAEAALHQALEEVHRLKERIAAENVYLHKELARHQGFDEVVGRSPAMREVLLKVEQAAPTNATILLSGETGTGKGLVAGLIHRRSRRHDKPFVTVNCSALPPTLIESELFGREKGSFTGATSQIGRFELADGGTLFLDEVGDLPLELQPKLLRAVQDGAFERVGSPRSMRVDVRIIAASHRNLDDEVAAGRFRMDLFYRLNVVPITLPPLREHPEDVPALVEHMLPMFAAKHDRPCPTVSASTMDTLRQYRWPGNVRELQNIIERAIITSTGPLLQIPKLSMPVADTHPAAALGGGSASSNTLQEVERAHVLRVLEKTGWRISGPGGAAEVLRIHPSTLRWRMQKLGIERA